MTSPLYLWVISFFLLLFAISFRSSHRHNIIGNTEFSSPIIFHFSRFKSIDEDCAFRGLKGYLFTWSSNKIADRNWARTYELLGSHKGTQWIANNIVGDILQYLAGLYNNAIDPTDIGYIKFSTLLRIFSIEQSEHQLQHVCGTPFSVHSLKVSSF